jgi:hypothetical protein
MKITKELAKFLAEEGSLTKFIDNYESQTPSLLNANFVIMSIIVCGFEWRITPEGYEYWSRLNETFIVYEIY